MVNIDKVTSRIFQYKSQNIEISGLQYFYLEPEIKKETSYYFSDADVIIIVVVILQEIKIKINK